MRRRGFRPSEGDVTTETDLHDSERGDTLVEVLLAIVILGIAGVALLAAFATSITSSAQHRQLASEDASVRAVSDEVIAQVQDASDAAFNACPTTYTPTWNLTGSFTVTNYNVQYWNGAASPPGFSSSCPTTGSPPTTVTTNPQLWTMTIGSGSYQTTVSTVIYDPQPITPTAGTTPAKLVFLQPTSNSGTGTINGPVNPQPVVAVEDAAGNIVTGDASSVTLTATGGSGTLSSNCSGNGNGGLFAFTNCSILGGQGAVGTYTLTAKDSNSAVPPVSVTYTITPAAQAKIGFTTSPISGGATNSPTLGKATVQVQDAFGNPQAGNAVTVNLSSSSTNGIFAATSGGAPITSVTIPAGQTSASFFYGDTTAGSPIITASASGLQSGLQTETITPGPENKLVISTAPPASVPAGTAFGMGVTIEDQFGNQITTNNTGSTDTIQLGLSTGNFSTGKSTVTVPASNGVATFTNLQINTPNAYTITATDTSHPTVTSATSHLTVTNAPPSKLVFINTAVTGNHPVGTTASVGPFQVQVQDQFGNPTTNNSGSSVSLLLSSTSTGTTFFTPTSGGTSAATVTIPSGASTSSNFYYSDTKAGSPTINASATVNAVSVSGSTNGFAMTALTTATGLSLGAADTTPTAGVGDNLTVTAVDAFGNTVTSYAGTKNLTFAGTTAIGSHTPTVSNSTGTVTNFGTATTITFTNGVATVTGTRNGVMTLYKVGTFNITVSDGTVNNGAGLPVTVGSAGAASLSLSAATTTPTVGAGDSLMVVAFDAFGNTATGYTGTKNLTFGGATASPNGTNPTVTNSSGTGVNFGTATAITFTNGAATVNGSSNGVMTLFKPGTVSITVTDGTNTNGTGLSVTVTALTTATGLSLGAADTTPTAGVGDNLTVTAVDPFGNAAAGYTGPKTLTFGGATAIGTYTPTVSNSTGTAINFGSSTAITFTNGVATVTGSSNGVMTLYNAGTFNITVSDGTLNNGTGLSVTVGSAGAASLSLSAATTTPTAGAADNLMIVAQDAFGNTATGYTGTKNLTFGGATAIGSHTPTVSNSTGTATNFGNTTAITFTNGVATVNGTRNGVMTLYKVGTSTITVSDGTVNNGTGLSVTVGVANTASLSVSATTTTPAAGAADNLTITASDGFGNTAVSYTGPKNLTFGGTAASPSGTNPTVSNASGTAVNFGTATAITFTNGVATVGGSNNGVMKLYNAGTASITVTDGTLNNGAGLSVTVTALSSATSLSLGAADTTPTAGVGDNLTVTAVDTFGNTVTSYTNSKNLTFGGATAIGTHTPTVSNSTGTATNFGNTTAITFTNGVATVNGTRNGVMTLYQVGTFNITVSDGTVNNGAGLSVTVGSAGAASLSLSAATTTPTAGAADNLTITAFDAFGNTATGYTGSKNLTFGGAATSPNGNNPTVSNASGAAVNFGTTTPITFTNGVATVTGSNNGVMKLYNAGTASITVTDGTVSNAGLSVTVTALSGATSLSLGAADTTPTAGVGDNLTVTAVDTYGNTVTSYTNSKNLSFGGATAIGTHTPTVSNSTGTPTNFGSTTAITFTNGVATVNTTKNGVMTLYQAGTFNITVSDGTITNGTGLSVTVSAAGTAGLSLNAADTTPTAGVADNLMVVAQDAFGNTTTGYTGSKNLIFGGATASPDGTNPTVTRSSGTAVNFGTTTPINFTNGAATVNGTSNGVMKLYKAGTFSITVSDGTFNNGTGLSVTVSPGTATDLAFAQQPSGGAHNTAINPAPTVQVVDTYGNAVALTKTVTMAKGTSPNNSTLSGTLTATTNANGLATFANLVPNKAGTWSIRASATNLNSATSNTFTES